MSKLLQKLADYQFIDIHYHAEPDLYQRRLTALEAGKIYQSLQGIVVLKSHLGATSVQATLAQRQGLPVLPSLVLNHIAGGIDYRVILRALAEYQPLIPAKMIVHFPTITGRKFQSKLPRQLVHPALSEQCFVGETVFDERKRLRRKVIDVLKMTRDYPLVLSTGHASKDETYALLDACVRYRVPALLLNQPAHPLTALIAEELQEISQHDFVWIEQTVLTHLLGHQDSDDLAKVLRQVPRVIYSSDLGQTSQMDITDWINYSANLFAEMGLSSQRKEALCRTNALALLSL
ncbi:DUF6282 family protein [Legionella feeleii]|uniref:Amidohydrolase n=1 Tax=Legionella feeleii TaxID=453 RepID=A0A0W0TMP3_9GAMM|nr:DUF6282 family protein [Legionella feeleii]KTC96849.1 hypothetical protein Lfee_1761 [Legionella feeleii]SPX60917.1 Uncharacterised protein [Legionella feeleii]